MDNNKFEYTYSAKGREEVELIKRKYLKKEEYKLEQLRKLDKSAELPGTIYAILVGIIGTLIMGTGMSLCLVWSEQYLILGIIIGILGIGAISSAYPIYKRITNKRREKIAPQILKLTEELLK